MTLVHSRMVRGRCPCGAAHAACGPPSTCTPVDENWEVAAVGGPLQKYDVTLPGGRKTVMKLNEADAERYNATLVDGEPEPDHEPEAAEAPAPKPAAKKRAVSNKARTAAADKDGGTGGGD